MKYFYFSFPTTTQFSYFCIAAYFCVWVRIKSTFRNQNQEWGWDANTHPEPVQQFENYKIILNYKVIYVYIS